MLVLRGYGLGGLGLGDAPPAPPVLTEGYCFKEGTGWLWTTPDQCAVPLKPGGAPTDKPGFCWNQLNPPNAFPGYWSRGRAGAPCAFPGPPAPPADPNDPTGFCKGDDGVWRWTLQSLCPTPVQQGTEPTSHGGVTVTDTTYTPDVVSGTPITISAMDRLYEKTHFGYYEREMAAVKAWSQSGAIPSCPAETIKPPSCVGCTNTCYNFAPSTMAGTIPGTFEVLGVPFNIAEPGLTRSPRFERVYTPNNEQRILVEGVIIRRSWGILKDKLDDLKNLSVNAALAKLGPRWVLSVPGMAFRSVAPKPSELEGLGGFGKFFKRGLLISLDVAEGKTRIWDDPSCPMACIGNKCRCGDAKLPACIGVGVPIADDDPNLPNGCFFWYAQAMPDGQMKLVGIHDDPTWLQRVGAKLAGFMEKFGMAACTAQPMIQAQMASSVAEVCTDKDNKPCTKGAAGCVCISPSAATQGAVGLFNFAAGKFCQGWMAEHAPQAPMPPIPDPPPVELPRASWLSLLPWIIGGLAIGGGAAFAFSRR